MKELVFEQKKATKQNKDKLFNAEKANNNLEINLECMDLTRHFGEKNISKMPLTLFLN